MRLGAVVEVALEAPPFVVGDGDEAGPRRPEIAVAPAQLVDGAPQLGVELGVLQCCGDEAHDARQALVVGVVEVVAARVAPGDEHPEQLALDRQRGDAEVIVAASQLRQP